MTDEDLAASVRKAAEALNEAIKAAAEAGITCLMSFGSLSNAKATSIIISDREAGNAILRIDLSKRL